MNSETPKDLAKDFDIASGRPNLCSARSAWMKWPRAVAAWTELQLKVATADRYSTKKQQSGQL